MDNLGGMFVTANIRGGGEYGEEWHLGGAKEHKQNGYDDFIGAAEYLINNGYTDKHHLAIQGGSNGGTLVTAVTNQRPDLFAAVLGHVPVTDMLRFSLFTIGKAWISEYGDSHSKGGVDSILKWSPLHTIKAAKYPAMLITTGDHDDRVVPAHSYKYMAELQYRAGNGKVPNQSPLLIQIGKNKGHSGGGGKEEGIKDLAKEIAFISRIMNLKWIDDPVVENDTYSERLY